MDSIRNHLFYLPFIHLFQRDGDVGGEGEGWSLSSFCFVFVILLKIASSLFMFHVEVCTRVRNC